MSKTPKAAPVADIDRLAQAGTLLDSMDATSTVPRGARRGIQSIEIGFGIIDVLCKATGPLPLRTIAARCDLPVANVHNYLVSFQRVGLVVQESDSAFYGLGSYAMKLGIAALQQFDVHKVARPIMAEIGAETGFTVFLGVWGNKGPTIVYRVEGAESPPVMELRVGSVLPLLTSALGRNFLSHLPAHMTSEMVREELAQQKRNPGARYAADVPRSLDGVNAMMVKVREQGLSTCVESFMPGFTAVSAPVFDQFGGMLAAITLMGPSSDVDVNTNSDIVKQLKLHSAKISQAAGWQR